MRHKTSSSSLLRRLLLLGAALGSLVIVVHVLAPLPIKYFGPMTEYVKHAEENNIHPGALYYTDVPVSIHGETNSRDTVHYYYDLPREAARKNR